MEILIALLLLLSLAVLLGKLFERIGLAEIVGQIIAGIILGPAILGIITPSSILSGIAEIAIFFILLFIGIQITTEVLTHHLRSATYFTMSSFAIPVIAMVLIAIFIFGVHTAQAVITSIAIGVPSISIVSVLVYKREIINTEDGLRLISGVIVTDIIAFIVLAAALQITQIPSTLVGIIIFIVVLLYLNRELKFHGKLLRKFFGSLIKGKSEDVLFAIVIIMSLVMAAILQLIGITYVLGALFAGMLINNASVGLRATRMLENTFRRLNDSFFIPVFFSIAGLEFIVPSGNYVILLLSMVATSAFVGGCTNYFIARRRLSKLAPKDAVGILGSRGAVGIIIGSIALENGIITSSLYTLVIFGTIILSLLMPLLLTKQSKKALRAINA